MLIKDLFCNEIVKDFKVKDPKTYHTDRAKELRKMKSAEVEVNGEIETRPIKVKSARPKKLKWNEDLSVWEFHCKIKVQVLD